MNPRTGSYFWDVGRGAIHKAIELCLLGVLWSRKV